jgi:hypothetical protein
MATPSLMATVSTDPTSVEVSESMDVPSQSPWASIFDLRQPAQPVGRPQIRILRRRFRNGAVNLHDREAMTAAS